ncbi:hypothetical protein OGAPHI_004629 [Ogataea philodendri]|uniref:non-specific serine/threonine protein kinase n=1 Tax=Ogataea philodendri TaxID=1378263 RepID=A0A9P8P326_9ASCO|nr:uncharacterized protein OGAPHI_004629 [Ogataea philodendri]KAH3664277.1 hypothetical protein OGAPHI_004629 [Ogataea philodendri]
MPNSWNFFFFNAKPPSGSKSGRLYLLSRLFTTMYLDLILVGIRILRPKSLLLNDAGSDSTTWWVGNAPEMFFSKSPSGFASCASLVDLRSLAKSDMLGNGEFFQAFFFILLVQAGYEPAHRFGTVYKGVNRDTKELVAIKILNLDTAEEEVKDVQQEIQFLSQLKTVPNVTHYYGSYLNGHKLWIVMDYCGGGSVRTLLRPGPLEEKYISIIVRELLVALQFIHQNGVIHRDIKAANILIEKDGRIKLCDFGVAAQLTATVMKRTTMVGTPYWMAPEVIMEGANYNVNADIWSLGITIYEMATGNPPYSDKDAMRAMQMITQLEPPRLEGRQFSANLKEGVATCLEEKPELRPSAEELQRSKLIKAYKTLSTSVLKEVISRYLLWRDSRPARESVYYDDEESINDDNEVKWDFDSLKSAEYMMENEISEENVPRAEATFDPSYAIPEAVEYTMNPTLRHGTMQTTMRLGTNSTAATTLRNTVSTTVPSSNTSAPKSLFKLFEQEESDEAEPEQRPELPVLQNTSIEIPSLDTVSQPAMAETRSRSQTVSRQEASPMPTQLEEANVHRENTSSTGLHMLGNRTPSPQRFKEPGLVPSPQRLGPPSLPHMKPLPSSGSQQPLLQPINSKLPTTGIPSGPQTAPPLSNAEYQEMKPEAGSLSRARSQIRLQMPVPMLHTQALDEKLAAASPDTMNQFGVNINLASNLPLAMTPVTEKAHLELGATPERDRSDSVISPRQPGRLGGLSLDVGAGMLEFGDKSAMTEELMALFGKFGGVLDALIGEVETVALNERADVQ